MTMDDYIKKEDAQKWLQSIRSDCGRYQDLWPYAEALEQIIELLNTDVTQVRRGKWVVAGDTTHYYICSICGKPGDYFDNYCRSCGAKMGGDRE